MSDVLSKEEIYSIIKITAEDLAEGISFGSTRNDVVLRLAYMALTKQETP